MNKMSLEDSEKWLRDQAYKTYSDTYDVWDMLHEDTKCRARRAVEAGITEQVGFKGLKTGLISEEALSTEIKNRNDESYPTKKRKSLEHPITHRVIALACLNRPTKLGYDEYFAFWFDTLITTITTSEENQRLRDYQKVFVLGVDCWREMYERAGIILVEIPPLGTNEDKSKHGINVKKKSRVKK